MDHDIIRFRRTLSHWLGLACQGPTALHSELLRDHVVSTTEEWLGRWSTSAVRAAGVSLRTWSAWGESVAYSLLTPAAVCEYCDHLEASGYRPGTIVQYLQVGQKLLRDAGPQFETQRAAIQFALSRATRHLLSQEVRMQPITSEQIDRLLGHVEADRDRSVQVAAVFLCMLDGMLLPVELLRGYPPIKYPLRARSFAWLKTARGLSPWGLA